MVAALGCARIGVANTGVGESSSTGFRVDSTCDAFPIRCCRGAIGDGDNDSARRTGVGLGLGVRITVCSSVVVRGAEGLRYPFGLTPGGVTLRVDDDEGILIQIGIAHV